MSRSLGLDVVAEGTDSQSDVDALREIGISVIQGYHVARPMDVAAMSEWLKSRQRPGVTSLITE